VRDSFRFHRGNWLTSGAYFVVLLAGVADHFAFLPYVLAAVSLISFAAWVVNYRQLRQIEDTPVSNIASAAQGYVEIAGHAEEPAGMPIRSRITDAACVWFHYEIRTDRGDLLESGDSDDPFIIRDATGQCVIDPEGARVFTSRRDAWTNGGRRYVESTLMPRDPICALGEFTTLSDTAEPDLDTDVGALLAEWKKNRPELLKRFDLDQDGTIDLREWELARRQARREVEARQRDNYVSVGTNVLRKPADGKPFLISNCVPDKIRNGYRIWTWVHILIFIGAGGGAFALL
jgi:hypothetical protein